jgi:hypothetical protein
MVLLQVLLLLLDGLARNLSNFGNPTKPHQHLQLLL